MKPDPSIDKLVEDRAYYMAYAPLRSAQHALDIISRQSSDAAVITLAEDESERIDQAIAALSHTGAGQGEAEVDALRSKLRCVISHATGGNDLGADAPLNDICVQISAHNNLIWKHAQEAALKPPTTSGNPGVGKREAGNAWRLSPSHTLGTGSLIAA